MVERENAAIDDAELAVAKQPAVLWEEVIALRAEIHERKGRMP